MAEAMRHRSLKNLTMSNFYSDKLPPNTKFLMDHKNLVNSMRKLANLGLSSSMILGVKKQVRESQLYIAGQ